MTSNLTQLGFLLLLAALVAILTRRLRLPYTVGLVLAGMALVILHVPTHLQLSRDLIFFVFLPPLIFEAAILMEWRELRRDMPVVGLLATVGVLLAASIVAVGMHLLLSWDWGSAAIFGVLIAATDPVSVIAMLKELGVSGRPRLLLEAESLLNDGTAAVAYVAVLGALSGEHQSALGISAQLGTAVVGGAAIGAAIGFGFMQLAVRAEDRLVELTLSVLSAYASFFIAESWHCSGILATLAAGIVVGNSREHGAKATERRQALELLWEFAAFVANSLVFILIGVEVAKLELQGWLLPAALAIALVILGRAGTIYALCALFAGSKLRIASDYQHLLFWGGLRGALALALALALPLAFPHRQDILTITFAVVAFSVIVQGLTVSPLIRRLRRFQ